MSIADEQELIRGKTYHFANASTAICTSQRAAEQLAAIRNNEDFLTLPDGCMFDELDEFTPQNKFGVSYPTIKIRINARGATPCRDNHGGEDSMCDLYIERMSMIAGTRSKGGKREDVFVQVLHTVTVVDPPAESQEPAPRTQR